MNYRGFSIEKEEGGRYAVRLHWKDRIDDWKPWADSLAEAKAIVDKLLGSDELEEGRN